MTDLTPILIWLVIAIVLFIVLREVNTWYWKINERILNQYKTNILLEKIAMRLGATDTDEIALEEISTGKRKKIQIDEWVKLKREYPEKAKQYRTINDAINV